MVKILNVCKGTGEIKDYELVFRGSHRNGAVATIEPKEGSTVPVAVWNISRYDEVGLDYYEGFPTLYGKQDFQVKMTDGSVITAMAYVMTPGRDFGKPSERYLATIAEGYSDFGISSERLFAAVECSEKRSDVNVKIRRWVNKQVNKYVPTCPRCGKKRMRDPLHYNALSRKADIYVCEACGTDEAIRAFSGDTDNLEEWYIAE